MLRIYSIFLSLHHNSFKFCSSASLIFMLVGDLNMIIRVYGMVKIRVNALGLVFCS